MLCAAEESTTDKIHAMPDEELLIPEAISHQVTNFNEAFFAGRDATTSKINLEYSEEMWHFFAEGSKVEELATKLGYDLRNVDAVPEGIWQN